MALTFEEVQQALYRMMALASDQHCQLAHGGRHESIAGCAVCDQIVDHCQFIQGIDNATTRASKEAATAIVGQILHAWGHRA